MALQGLMKVAAGHQKMRDNLDKLHNDEVRHTLGDFARDLKLISVALGSH